MRRVSLVMGKLNTNKEASFYEAFAPEKSRALCERFEFHYTPKHGSNSVKDDSFLWPTRDLHPARAERAGVSRSTLHLMENGSAGASLGKLLQVLVVLGLDADLSRIAADDVLGRKLEDARLTETRQRAPKQKSRK